MWAAFEIKPQTQAGRRPAPQEPRFPAGKCNFLSPRDSRTPRVWGFPGRQRHGGLSPQHLTIVFLFLHLSHPASSPDPWFLRFPQQLDLAAFLAGLENSCYPRPTLGESVLTILGTFSEVGGRRKHSSWMPCFWALQPLTLDREGEGRPWTPDVTVTRTMPRMTGPPPLTNRGLWPTGCKSIHAPEWAQGMVRDQPVQWASCEEESREGLTELWTQLIPEARALNIHWLLFLEFSSVTAGASGMNLFTKQS